MKLIKTSFFVFILMASLFAISFLFFNKIKAENIDLELVAMEEITEIIVKFKNNINIEVIKIDETGNLEKIINFYNNDERIEYAEPNYKYKISATPSDVYYDKQWYLKKIKAPEAWDTINQSPSVIIAVLDTGVQIDHPDLRNNIWKNKKEIPFNNIDDDKNGFIDDINGWDFIDNVPDPSPKFEAGYNEENIMHGTIVSGILAASGNNGIGIAGVTWKARIMPLRVLNDSGQGRAIEVIRAIDYAIKNQANIINLSFIGLGYSQGLYEAIERAYKAGVIVVAAAGNESFQGHGYNLDSLPIYPACYSGKNGENIVIGVAATDALDQKANFSSFGANCVDIAAPGNSIFSTVVYAPAKSNNFNTYYGGYWSGTSMATPIVSGAIALLEELSVSLNRDEIIFSLLFGADNISRLNPKYIGLLGTGRLNIKRSVEIALSKIELSDTNLILAPYASYQSSIKIADQSGNDKLEFFAYDENFRGGVNVAAGDLDGDGKDEIISGAGPGGGPHVRIFSNQGKLLNQFFAYDKNFRGGVNVAAGDLDGDGKDEIISGAGPGGGPHVRIFSNQGKLLNQFFAYDENFRGGVNVAAGDLDGDGKDEIISGAGPGGGPHVRIFSNQGKLLNQFFAYDKNFRGGVRLATGNINVGTRNYGHEIITAPGPGGGPHIRMFNIKGELQKEFFAYGNQYRGGVQIAVGDMDQDGISEIITGTGPVSVPYVRIFKSDGKLINSFYAFPEESESGVNIAVMEIKK